MYPYIHIFGIDIPTYGLCMAIALCVVVGMAALRAVKRKCLVEDILIVSVCGFLGAMVGAKLLYILVTYRIEVVLSQLFKGNFKILSGGGLVFYGGLIGGVFGALIGARIAKVKLWELEDSIIPALPLGHSIGRVGCFFAGCCYGVDGFLIQLVEAGINIVIMWVLICLARRSHRHYELLAGYGVLYGVCRFGLEFFRGDLERGIYGGLSTSQYISIVIFVMGILFLMRNRKDGVNE